MTKLSPPTSSSDKGGMAEAGLYVDNVQKEDSGAYQCVVGVAGESGNGVSETQASAELRLGGKKRIKLFRRRCALIRFQIPTWPFGERGNFFDPSIRRRVPPAPLHLHRPDPAAGSSRLAQVFGQRKSNPQHQVDARRIPVAKLGEVRRMDRLLGTGMVGRSVEGEEGLCRTIKGIGF